MILDEEIFIVQQNKPSEVQVFDYRTFKHLRNISVPALQAAWDITYSGNILFVAEHSSGLIHRVPLNSSEPINSWSVGDEKLRLSTLKSDNILVTCCHTSKLIEYTTTGQLVREIPLQQDITNLRHAIQMDDDQFLVCHTNSLHRVCLIDNKGQLIKSYGGAQGSRPGQLDYPNYLVADVNGSCLVADYGGNRIILLNAGLQFMKELIPRSSGLKCPARMCLDRNRKKLFVAEYNSNGRVVVFDILPWQTIPASQLNKEFNKLIALYMCSLSPIQKCAYCATQRHRGRHHHYAMTSWQASSLCHDIVAGVIIMHDIVAGVIIMPWHRGRRHHYAMTCHLDIVAGVIIMPWHANFYSFFQLFTTQLMMILRDTFHVTHSLNHDRCFSILAFSLSESYWSSAPQFYSFSFARWQWHYSARRLRDHYLWDKMQFYYVRVYKFIQVYIQVYIQVSMDQQAKLNILSSVQYSQWASFFASILYSALIWRGRILTILQFRNLAEF